MAGAVRLNGIGIRTLTVAGLGERDEACRIGPRSLRILMTALELFAWHCVKGALFDRGNALTCPCKAKINEVVA